MGVTILTQKQKEKAAAMVNDGATLTSVGDKFGVSRKTIRRVVDEINGQTKAEVQSEPVLTKEQILVKISKNCAYAFGEEMDFDTVFVATKREGRENIYDISGQDLLDAGGEHFYGENNYTFFSNWLEEISATPEVVEDDVIGVGDIVTISENSEFWYPNFDDDCNPKGVSGEVVNINHSNILPINVDWFNGTQNTYNFEDLVLVAKAKPDVVEVEIEVELEPEDNADYFFSATQDSISMVRVDGSDVETRNINKSSGQFTELRNMLVEDTSNETLKYVFTMMDTRAVIEAFSVGRVKVDTDAETVVFVKPDGSERKVPEELSLDIIDTVKTYGRDRGEHLVKFLDKLMDNPSFSAIEGLYRFMKHNCIEINPDGSIQAWKGVDNDLYSHRGGDIKGSDTIKVDSRGRVFNGDFGKEVRVPRSEVDDNPDNTCSKGLHVGNKEYATNWANTLLKVRVEPQDVVAVPKDYDGAKMRACAYTPLEVVAK